MTYPDYTVYLSLGSNIPPCQDHLLAALSALKELGDLTVSSFYETPPWGITDQSPFVNACSILRTAIPPEELLIKTQAIEKQRGRVRLRHWGERTLDIDLLHVTRQIQTEREGEAVSVAVGITSQTDSLRLPHPFLFQRAFVLIPLLEIAPEFHIDGKSGAEALAALPDHEKNDIILIPTSSSVL